MASKKKNAPDRKLWVICEIGFEYNDEIYHRPESGGGRPVEAFTSKEKADAACKENNFKCFLETWSDLGQYQYDISDNFSDEAIELMEKHGLAKSEFDNTHWQKIPPEDLQKIYDGCNISWYEVYEVDEVGS
jgi:hypothetical protein